MTIEEKLTKLGLKLPQPVKPMAAYIPAKRVGDLVFVSGQVPFKDGNLAYVGKVGAECTQEEGYQAARLCALNGLAAVKALVGSLDAISEIVQVRGFVNCTPDFENQPAIINGASELLVELYGERGRHARAALGTSSLPRNVPVEVEMIVHVGEVS